MSQATIQTPAPPQPLVALTPAPQPQAQLQPAVPTPLVIARASTPAAATPAPQPLHAAPTPLTFVRAGTPAAVTPAPIRATPAPAILPPAATPFQAPGVARTEPPRSNDQDFVRPTLVEPTTHSSTQLPPSGVNEVQVAAVKKTWVTVRRDDPKAPPIFEDYIYPSANPLKLKGARFFIDARDPNSVQITKNGLPYAYQAPNIPVQ